MHNRRNHIARGKGPRRGRNTADQAHKSKLPAAPGAKATKPSRKAAGAERKPYTSFPANAVVPATRIGAVGTGTSDTTALVVRQENLVADRLLITARRELMERQIVCAARSQPVPKPVPEPAAAEAKALPLPIVAEPLVVDAAPLPRERALVAPPRGLFERIARWLGKTSRVARPAASTAEAPERPDVALLRAELRELRAQLAVARRMAERREELVRTGVL